MMRKKSKKSINQDNKNYRKHLAINTDSNLKPIMIVIVCTILTSLGQILFKYATKNLNDFYSIITNIPLIAGFVSYALGAILLIIALKYGDLSMIYPFVALSFVWVTLLSIWLFSEHVSLANWIGIAAILIGVSAIGFGSKK